jgi:hypothetical protein
MVMSVQLLLDDPLPSAADVPTTDSVPTEKFLSSLEWGSNLDAPCSPQAASPHAESPPREAKEEQQYPEAEVPRDLRHAEMVTETHRSPILTPDELDDVQIAAQVTHKFQPSPPVPSISRRRDERHQAAATSLTRMARGFLGRRYALQVRRLVGEYIETLVDLQTHSPSKSARQPSYAKLTEVSDEIEYRIKRYKANRCAAVIQSYLRQRAAGLRTAEKYQRHMATVEHGYGKRWLAWVALRRRRSLACSRREMDIAAEIEDSRTKDLAADTVGAFVIAALSETNAQRRSAAAIQLQGFAKVVRSKGVLRDRKCRTQLLCEGTFKSDAACLIQCFARCRVAVSNRRQRLHNASAVKVQRSIRGFFAREKYEELKSERIERWKQIEREQPAYKIAVPEDAAKVIQRNVRMSQAKKFVKKLREERMKQWEEKRLLAEQEGQEI